MPTLKDSDYRLMVDAVADYAIFLMDPKGYLLSWNSGARLLKGYEAEEVLGRHFSMFYPRDLVDIQWPEHELAEAARLGRFEDEGWRQRKDGSLFWANVVITRLGDPDGTLRGFSKITRDLTEKRQQEEMLRQSEERYRALVEHVKDYAIFMLDPEGCVLSWNLGAETMKGYSAAEITGQHFSKFYPAEVVEDGWPDHELEMALREGRFEDEGWRIRKDGSRFWASVVITALHDQNGNHRGFTKVTRDLTERRRISALEDEGRRMTTFLAMLGHELRNPLAPISNALSILQVADIASPPLRTARDVIGRQMALMTRLVDDLLDLGRITSGKIHLDLHPVKVREVIAEAVEVVAPQIATQQHTLTTLVDPEELWVNGDRQRLIQILVSLLHNACKFTQAGGSLGIRLRKDGDRAELSVKDNGPGISPQLIADVFNLFVQGEQDSVRTRGGLGLGLSLVQQLTTLHGGEVSAFSTGQAGKGSEFVVRLPLIEAPVESPAPSCLPLSATAQRILLVDDNTDSTESFHYLLSQMGYSVEALHDGARACERILRDPPDLAIVDIGLPGMTGLELAEHVTREMRHPPVLLALSGYGLEKDREASLRAGFQAHLVKPLSFRELVNALRTWLAPAA